MTAVDRSADALDFTMSELSDSLMPLSPMTPMRASASDDGCSGAVLCRDDAPPPPPSVLVTLAEENARLRALLGAAAADAASTACDGAERELLAAAFSQASLAELLRCERRLREGNEALEASERACAVLRRREAAAGLRAQGEEEAVAALQEEHARTVLQLRDSQRRVADLQERLDELHGRGGGGGGGGGLSMRGKFGHNKGSVSVAARGGAALHAVSAVGAVHKKTPFR